MDNLKALLIIILIGIGIVFIYHAGNLNESKSEANGVHTWGKWDWRGTENGCESRQCQVCGKTQIRSIEELKK